MRRVPGGKMIEMIWKPTREIANLVSSFLLVFVGMRKNGKMRSAKDDGGGRVEFAPDPLIYLAWPLIVFLPAWAAINDLQLHAGRPWGVLFPAAILAAAAMELFRFPGTVVVAYDGIEQHFWLRGEKRIRWGEISEIKESETAKTLTIIGADGTKIVFSSRLADPQRFREEIGKHYHGVMPQDPPTGSNLGFFGGRKLG